MKIGEGEGNLSRERFPSPSPNPTPFPSKTFVLIESLPKAFPVFTLPEECPFFKQEAFPA